MNGNSKPWPRKDDELFNADVDWWYNACLNYLPDDWAPMQRVTSWLETCWSKPARAATRTWMFLSLPDSLPLQADIELRLKRLIRDGKLLLENTGDFPPHHRIDQLWVQCRNIIEEVWPKGSTKDLDAVEERIHQFAQTDPASMAF